MTKEAPIQPRKSFRIKYPECERPTVTIDRHDCPVFDCSESGLKTRTGLTVIKAVDDIITVKIKFQCGDSHKTKARVVNVSKDFLMIELHKAIPQDILKKEADRLLAKYGKIDTPHYLQPRLQKIAR